jgi:transposase
MESVKNNRGSQQGAALMKRSVKHVGLDVHQASTVAVVRNENGKIIARGIFATEEEAILSFVRGMRGPVHVAFEEGTQAQWLYDLLKPRVHRVVVCDRRGEKKQGNKADNPDAERLSDDLRCGRLRVVYHDSAYRVGLKELARTYLNLVEDATRAMQRLKALFRARAIPARGMGIYQPENRAEWLAKLPDEAVRFRARMLFAQLDTLRELRPQAKERMVAEARKDPAWKVLRSIPFMGPVRVSLILATMRTPWRFSTKRNLWAYSGLAVVTKSSADYEIHDGRPVKRRRKPLTRGLNQNHNRILKNVFKGAATAATGKAGPLQDFYRAMLERGMREELARVTLTRKVAAITLRLWKRGETYDPAQLTMQAQ